MTLLVATFVFFAPFTTWLAISTWLRLPVTLLLVLATASFPQLLAAIVKRPFVLLEDKEDLLVYAFLVFAVVSWSLGYGAGRSLNHLMAYSLTLLGYFVLFKVVVREMRIRTARIVGFIAWSAIACSTIVVTEFILINAFDIGLRQWFLTGGPRTSNMDFFYRGFYKSIAGTAEEPGSMALFLNIFCPIGMWHFSREGKTRYFGLLLVLYMLSLVCLTSVGGVVICATCAGLIAMLRLESARWFMKRLGFPILVALGIFFWVLADRLTLVMNSVGKDLIYKLAFSAESSSASVRTDSWHTALQVWTENPFFGMGPGYGVESLGWGYHSFFLTVLADLGIFNLLLLCAFFVVVFLKLLSLPRRTALWFTVPVVGSFMHFNIVGDYFHAPFWIALALVQMMYAEQQADKKGEAAWPSQSSR